MILFSWFGIIGYALLAYAIFAEGQEWAFGGAAFFLIFFLIRYHSLNPFAPWISKKTNSKTADTSNTQQMHQTQPTQQTQQAKQTQQTQQKKQLVEEQAAPEPAKPVVKHCSNCGAQMQEGQIFCENCGTRVG